MPDPHASTSTVRLDLELTLGPHRRGPRDPAMRLGPGHVIRATRTADGPATLEIRHARRPGRRSRPGARARNGRSTAAPAFIGIDDDRSGFAPAHRLLADLDRRLPGLRIGRSGAVLEALIPAILEQKVTGTEARRGVPRPHRPVGRAGARAVRAAAAARAGASSPRSPTTSSTRSGSSGAGPTSSGRSPRGRPGSRRSSTLPLADAYARLTALPGIGPWTAAEVAIRALGDPDAVSVGDYHLPSLVAYALAGERRGDRRADARAARAVPRPSRPGDPAARGERDPARRRTGRGCSPARSPRSEPAS